MKQILSSEAHTARAVNHKARHVTIAFISRLELLQRYHALTRAANSRPAGQSDGECRGFRQGIDCQFFLNGIQLFLLESGPVIRKNCQIPAELEIEGVRAALEPVFGVHLSEPTAAKATFYDTFEWGVWFGDRLLYQSNGALRLCERDHDWIGDVRHALPMAAKRVPRFEWEFPEGGCAEELKPLLGIRSLMRVARLSIREQAVELVERNAENGIPL